MPSLRRSYSASPRSSLLRVVTSAACSCCPAKLDPQFLDEHQQRRRHGQGQQRPVYPIERRRPRARKRSPTTAGATRVHRCGARSSGSRPPHRRKHQQQHDAGDGEALAEGDPTTTTSTSRLPM
jgi:hypothetical protein